jgi:hypothetical protein
MGRGVREKCKRSLLVVYFIILAGGVFVPSVFESQTPLVQTQFLARTEGMLLPGRKGLYWGIKERNPLPKAARGLCALKIKWCALKEP